MLNQVKFRPQNQATTRSTSDANQCRPNAGPVSQWATISWTKFQPSTQSENGNLCRLFCFLTKRSKQMFGQMTRKRLKKKKKKKHESVGKASNTKMWGRGASLFFRCPTPHKQSHQAFPTTSNSPICFTQTYSIRPCPLPLFRSLSLVFLEVMYRNGQMIYRNYIATCPDDEADYPELSFTPWELGSEFDGGQWDEDLQAGWGEGGAG